MSIARTKEVEDKPYNQWSSYDAWKHQIAYGWERLTDNAEDLEIHLDHDEFAQLEGRLKEPPAERRQAGETEILKEWTGEFPGDRHGVKYSARIVRTDDQWERGIMFHVWLLDEEGLLTRSSNEKTLQRALNITLDGRDYILHVLPPTAPPPPEVKTPPVGQK